MIEEGFKMAEPSLAEEEEEDDEVTLSDLSSGEKRGEGEREGR